MTRQELVSRISTLLARMEVLSEVSARSYEHSVRGESDGFPPGTFRDESTTLDESMDTFHRLCEALEASLYQNTKRHFTAEDRDERIASAYPDRNPRFVAYVEDIHEDRVVDVRLKHGLRVQDGKVKA